MTGAVHPGRALYSTLRYWRSAGLHQLAIPEMEDEPEDLASLDLEKSAFLQQRKEACAQCKDCLLHEGRSISIYGQGPLRSPIMMVGAAPSDQEEASAQPFQGEEGDLVDRMLEKMGFNRNQIYICHALACRPPDDRAPTWDEILSCRHWLLEQIEQVSPTCIVTLGTVASQALLERQVSISKIRGQWQSHKNIPVMPTYHPGYLLKKTSARKDVWSDMLAVLEVLKTRN